MLQQSSFLTITLVLNDPGHPNTPTVTLAVLQMVATVRHRSPGGRMQRALDSAARRQDRMLSIGFGETEQIFDAFASMARSDPRVST
jgi:hypothetical protein